VLGQTLKTASPWRKQAEFAFQYNLANNSRKPSDRLVYRWARQPWQARLKLRPLFPQTQVVKKSLDPILPVAEAPRWRVMGYACGTCRMGSDPAISRGGALNGRSQEWAT